uniref:AB hydrolase-1 domain-containing protein n=1 Tax=Stomoxys calcitrans TaxID=35570 RepID=A0A1I8PM72_STOCA
MDLMLTLERPKFSILGWSAGGNAAIVAASRYQNNIEKLVIWGTGAYVTPEEVKLFEGMRDCGSGPKSVLLMPGILGSIWTDFAPQVEQLPKLLPNHTIIAWDPPGYGKSIPPQRNWQGYVFDDDAQLAMDLMSALGRPTFSFVAWSAGTMSAMIAASRYPHNIEKLIMWGGAAYLTPSEIKFYKSSRDVSKWPEQMRKSMEMIYGADNFALTWNNMVDYICVLEKERGGDFCKSHLKNIKAPIFLLHGRRDPVKDPEHVPYLKKHLKIESPIHILNFCAQMQSLKLIVKHQLQYSAAIATRSLCSHIERKVKVNNVDLNVVQSGSGPKSVLLMPGVLGSIWSDFAPQIEQLPKLLPNHTIIAWDPPGYGKSIPPRRNWHLYIFDEDAQFAMDLMKTLGRPKFSLVAWSAGTMSAMMAASRHPDNIEKLVMWGAAAYLAASEIEFYKNSRDVSKWPEQMRKSMEVIYGIEKFPLYWNDLVDYICAMEKHRGGDFCKNDLKNIKAPIFLLNGAHDPVKDPEHIPYLKERLNIARFKNFLKLRFKLQQNTPKPKTNKNTGNQ